MIFFPTIPNLSYYNNLSCATNCISTLEHELHLFLVLFIPLCSAVDAAAMRLEGLTQTDDGRFDLCAPGLRILKRPHNDSTVSQSAAASLRFVLGTVGNGNEAERMQGEARRVESQRIVSCTHTGAAIRHRRTAMHHRAKNVPTSPPLWASCALDSCSFSEVTLCSRRVCSGCTCNPRKVQLLRRCVGVQKFLCRLEESCCMGQQRDTQNIHGNAAAAPAPAQAQEAAAAARIHILAWAWAEPTTTSQ